jgi:5-methylcytosine-specific restriction enzyme subunit McrC
MEEYVLVCLKKQQTKLFKYCCSWSKVKTFWNGITIRPDIVIEKQMKHLLSIPNGRT